PEGNPHHIREYAPAELEEALGRRFSNVRLVRQHAWLASALLPDQALAASEGEIEADVGKAAGIPAGLETFSIALASDAELPDPRPLVVLGPEVDQRESMLAMEREKDLHAKDE